jgi:IMP cyclohydrolase
MKGLEALQSKSYPGRIIIIGKDLSGQNVVVVYAITGRSPSSQARKIVFEDNCAWVKPTDKEILKNGNVDLLIYPAISVSRGIAVSNGKQTRDIQAQLEQCLGPVEALMNALEKWDYEPDAPAYTPRISGSVISSHKAALSIIKRSQGGSSLKIFFEFSLEPGRGKMIATYSGKNQDPLPSFEGEPEDFRFEGSSAQQTVENVYSAMNPQISSQDFRVAIACLFQDMESGGFDIAIINKHERKG